MSEIFRKYYALPAILTVITGCTSNELSNQVLEANAITIEALNPQQEITLMGTDMERSQFFLYQASNPQQIANWVHQDINFDYSRVSYDRKQELIEGATNFSFYKGAIRSMKLVQQANKDIKFWATLKSDYDGYGTTNNLPDWIYTGGGYNGGHYDPELLKVNKYARFLADYLKLMSENGVAISVLSVVKEWSQVVDAKNEIAVLKEITRLLATSDYKGVPLPEFSGPSTWGTKQAINTLNSYIEQHAQGLFNGISTHSYDKASAATWTSLVVKANDAGLPVWHTESLLGSGPSHGVELKTGSMLRRLLNRAKWYRAGIQGELFFEPWSRGVARETRSIYFSSGEDGVRLRPYYIMKQFANHAPAGARYIPTTKTGLANTDTIAFSHNDKIILWLLNSSESSQKDITIRINGKKIMPSAITRLAWYQGAQTSGDTSTENSVDASRFITKVEPKSIVSYVFNLK